MGSKERRGFNNCGFSVVKRGNRTGGTENTETKQVEIKEKRLISFEISRFYGGDYWTRTSGLMRVKHAL